MTHKPYLSVYRDDPAYPSLLATIPDPPDELWLRGRVDLLSAEAVAIVGSRGASRYALEIAAALAFDLARCGLVVVSGMARGVDGAAHRGALDAGGATVAVLGSGVNVPYPAEHADLLLKIASTGAVVSELPPGTPPLAHNFPRRNRIISGLSRAVVVVEAHERSGSLITARCALEQGRDVMAVPGNALSGRNRGSHALLKDGAKLVEGVDDILEELGLRLVSIGVDPRNLLFHNGLMLNMQVGETYGLDELGAVSGLPASELLPILTELELSGQVIKTSGGRFALASKRV
ncbi:MAG: DNA-processing protein DprA [Acidobacteriota bacterium]